MVPLITTAVPTAVGDAFVVFAAFAALTVFVVSSPVTL